MKETFGLKQKIGMFAFCFGCMANNLTMALVGYIMKTYAGQADASVVQNILVTPSLVATVYAFCVGTLNTKFSTKKLLLFGQACLLSMGMIFLFLGGKCSIWVLIAAAGLVGIGQGSNNTILGSMLASMIPDEKTRGNYVGIFMASMNVGGVFFSILGGKLNDITGNWQTAYALFFIVALAIVLEAICLPEGAVAKKETAASTENAVAGKMPIKVWLISIQYFFFFLCLYCYGSNISQYVVNEYKLGGGTEAGIASSVVTIGGIIAGAAFGVYSQWFKKMTVPIMNAMACGGLFLCLILTNTIWGAYIGGALCGFSMSGAAPYVMMELGRIAPGPMYSKAMSIYSGFMNAGMCVAIYVLNFLTKMVCGNASDMHTKFLIATIMAAACVATALPIYLSGSKAE